MTNRERYCARSRPFIDPKPTQIVFGKLLHSPCTQVSQLSRPIYTLVGIGGAGKTATIDRFLQIVPGGSPAPLDPLCIAVKNLVVRNSGPPELFGAVFISLRASPAI